MSPRTTIVTICGDAGGAAAIAPVLARLQCDEALTLANFAYSQAPAVLAQARVGCIELDSGDVESARQILDRERASLLLSATSVNKLEIEKRFVVAARQAGCPSVGVLDFWSNYAERFTDGQGGISCAPDVLAVMDTRAAAEAREAGIRSDLRITGQPAFDRLAGFREAFDAEARAVTRHALGALESDFLVLFVSQALDDLYGDAKARVGFNEREVLALVTRTLAAMGSERLVLAIRRHPRERATANDDRDTRVKIVRDDTPDRWNAVMAADLVVGMNSVLLLEASYLGAAVLSVQPELRGNDSLPSNRWGGSMAAYRSDEAARLLAGYISNAAARQRLRERAITHAPDGRATERVCDCVHEQLVRAASVARE